jgi:DNA-binding CsgD family transcriptional regulator
MADGLTARQVAHRLGISRRTVEGHLRVLRELTGARSIGELCAVSVAEGWVTPGRSRQAWR